MLTAPLKTPLTHIDDDLTHEALDAFVMVRYIFFFFFFANVIYFTCNRAQMLVLK